MLTKALRILKPRSILGASLHRRSVSFSTPSPALSSSGAISRTTADAAEIDADDEIAYSDPTESATAIPVMMPGHLQPRVVVYDGVCHLCHGGTMLSLPIFKHRTNPFLQGSLKRFIDRFGLVLMN